MALKDLAYTEEELTKNKSECCAVPANYEGPKYPWGLNLELDDETLNKLGVDITKFKIGEKVPIRINATVTGISINMREDHESKRVSLIAGEMEISKSKTVEEQAEALYGKD